MISAISKSKPKFQVVSEALTVPLNILISCLTSGQHINRVSILLRLFWLLSAVSLMLLGWGLNSYFFYFLLAQRVELPQQYDNLDLICNVRHDTVLYDFPPAKTGKKGRPKVKGRKLSFDDFTFSIVDGTGYAVGSRQVITNLFGKKTVHAIITKTSNGSQKLFICTKDPHQLNFDFNSSASGKALLFAKADIDFLPLTVYSMRWSIEVAYYEQKKFWALGNYMLRSKIGIERLTNLLTLLYSFMIVLPFYDKTFSALSHNSPQQSRFVIGMTVWHELFLTTFETNCISSKNVFAFASFAL